MILLLEKVVLPTFLYYRTQPKTYMAMYKCGF